MSMTGPWHARTGRPLGLDLAAVGFLVMGMSWVVVGVAQLLPPSTIGDVAVGLSIFSVGLLQLYAYVTTADQRRFSYTFGVAVATIGLCLVAIVTDAATDAAKIALPGLAITALLWSNRDNFLD